MESQKNTTVKNIVRIIWWAVFLIITAWSAYMLFDGRGTKAFMGLLTIASLIVIGVWQRKSRYAFPDLFAGMTYVFIFIAVGLGTFGGFYSIHHFDDFLHLSSGIWIGYGAWILMGLIVGDNLVKQLPKFFIGLYIIVFALAVAGAWELLEFAGDKLFHFTAQGRDPDDTMFDMIDGLIGGIIASIFIVRSHSKQTNK
ncbi:hypothetical protein [Bacillus massiliigorillae]|uniref:hypothetical protein n=1 Tax=Bacillus massiliigorillae TaxID=1243664 RepID=UPI0006942E8F|nr:hypothetical protein [Bacillus massiliigorillae]